VGLQRLARIGFVVGTLFIVVVSLLPADDIPSLGMWDKLEHALTYATVAALGGVGWAGNTRSWGRIGVLLASLGAILEVLQTFVPGRLGDVADAAANVIGTIAGMTAVAVLGRLAGRASRVGKGW
jgi:VanZ family protein